MTGSDLDAAPANEPGAERALEADAPPAPQRMGFHSLEDVIADDCFPELDLALRRGRHIHQGDERWYAYLLEAQPWLETFYRRYGCELEQRGDGYFFLLPVSDGLGKRHLGVPEMIVGQGLALCFLDPRSVQSGGLVSREELLNQLASVMGTDALVATLNPKRKRADERVMQRTVRQKVNEALRRLSQLGFVELLDGEQLRLWPSLMRFAEPVRGLDAPSEALKRLIERGEVSLVPAEPDSEGESESDADGELDGDSNAEQDADARPPSGSQGGSESPREAASRRVAAPDLASVAEAAPEPRAASAEPEPAGSQPVAPAAEFDAEEMAFESEPPSPPESESEPASPAYPELELEWDDLPDEKA